MSSGSSKKEDPKGLKGQVEADHLDAEEEFSHWPASNRPTSNTLLPDFKDQVHNAMPPPPQGSIKHKQDTAVVAKVGNRPPAPTDGGPTFKDQVRQQPPRSVDLLQREQEGGAGGPRFKDQCAHAQTTSQEMQTGQLLPLTARAVDDYETEEQIRRRILGEAVEAQVVSPSQLQPLLMCHQTLTCRKAMLYVVAGLVFMGIVLGVVLLLALGGGPTHSTGVVNPPLVSTNSTNSPSTEAPTPTPTGSPPTDSVVLLENTKLTASDAAAGDGFGWSVAIAGDTVVVGARSDDDNDFNSGSAYIFMHTGSTWMAQAKLTATDGASESQFGTSVAIAGDTIVVGAHRDDDNGTDSGSAYAFTYTGTTWTQQAKLTASDGAHNDEFGRSVAIAGDTIVVGAWRNDDSGITDRGSVYVFTRTGTTWSEQAKLTASDGAAFDEFGTSVAIAGDTIVVGAYRDDDNGFISGSAYIFTRTGTAWMEQAKLTASDGAASDGFGISVAIDGDTIVVGAQKDDVNDIKNMGSAYVYSRTETTWTQQAKLTASDGAAFDQFGWSVAIAGGIIVVGARYDDANGLESGSAYIFMQTGVTWIQQAQLTASDGMADDVLGYSVAISMDTILVGALRDDDRGTNSGSLSGSAYVYELN